MRLPTGGSQWPPNNTKVRTASFLSPWETPLCSAVGCVQSPDASVGACPTYTFLDLASPAFGAVLALRHRSIIMLKCYSIMMLLTVVLLRRHWTNASGTGLQYSRWRMKTADRAELSRCQLESAVARDAVSCWMTELRAVDQRAPCLRSHWGRRPHQGHQAHWGRRGRRTHRGYWARPPKIMSSAGLTREHLHKVSCCVADCTCPARSGRWHQPASSCEDIRTVSVTVSRGDTRGRESRLRPVPTSRRRHCLTVRSADLVPSIAPSASHSYASRDSDIQLRAESGNESDSSAASAWPAYPFGRLGLLTASLVLLSSSSGLITGLRVHLLGNSTWFSDRSRGGFGLDEDWIHRRALHGVNRHHPPPLSTSRINDRRQGRLPERVRGGRI